MMQEETMVCNSIHEPSLTHGGVRSSFEAFPLGRPPDRVLDFIIRIEGSCGLMDVEMHSENDDQTIMTRVVKRQHGGISLILVWESRIAIVGILTANINGIVGLHRFDCWEEKYFEDMIEFMILRRSIFQDGMGPRYHFDTDYVDRASNCDSIA
jgi:hypothetical protein